MTRNVLGIAAFAAWLLCSTPAVADQQRLPLWQVEGKHNTVYLLGSVHLLRESDYPLPAGLYAAYDDAETLIMELDMDDIDAMDAQSMTRELGVIGNGGNLAAMMGDTDYRRASELAAAAGVPIELLAGIEPWLASLTAEQIVLTAIGFEAGHGIEAHFTERAVADGKEIRGLETLRQQLQILDRLPLTVQRKMLLLTLEDSVNISRVMQDLLAAWRRGDTAALETDTLADMREHPVLHRELVVERNRDWVRQLRLLLGDADDYLVIVGTLHLVGPEGVPSLLSDAGFTVKQMTQP